MSKFFILKQERKTWALKDGLFRRINLYGGINRFSLHQSTSLFGIDGEFIVAVTGALVSIVSVLAYIITEDWVDTANTATTETEMTITGYTGATRNRRTIKMNLNKLLLTKNNCYKAQKTITVKGLMLHSTGANNPNLKRYVGPDDGKLGVNSSGNHWNQPTPSARQICCHGFIGQLKDGTVATYQTLPWNHRGWHCGVGKNGTGNNTHVGVEVCEGDLTDKAYFDAVYQEAVELFAYLCKQYNLNPTADGVIIDHAEGYKRGIASNHADITHWFKKQGKTMDDFRKAVKVATNQTADSAYKTSDPNNKNGASKHKMPSVNLKKGSKGDGVKWVQDRLNQYGYKLSLDGDFGPKTDAAVRAFQKAKKLIVDGIAGEKTREALS